MKRRSALACAILALILTAGPPRMASARIHSRTPRPINRTIYVGLASGHVYRNAIGTFKWQQSDHGLPGASDITALAITSDGGTLYAATWGSGLYASTDGGKHWRDAGGPRTNPGVNYISGLALNPEHGQTVYVVTSDDRFHTATDAGAHWDATLLPVDLIDSVTTTSLAVSRSDPTMMLVGTELEGIVRSADGGRTWSDTNLYTDVSVNALTFSPKSANVAYAATDKGVYRTIDGGASWQAEQRGIPHGTQFQSIAVDPRTSARVLAGTADGQIYRSLDGGARWALQGRAGGSQINAMLFDPAHAGVVVAGTSDAGTMYRSEDNGGHWSGYATGFDPADDILALAASSR
jgi:photosystem II stability/assembly factor-like uncharacterized protein